MGIIDQILDKAGKVTDRAEVFHTVSEQTGAAWSTDALKIAEGKETSGVALRVLVDGKIGFFSTSRVDDPDLVVSNACELAKHGTEFGGEFPTEYKPADSDTYSDVTASIDADKLVKAGNGMIKEAKEACGDARYDGKLTRDIIRADIASTTGASASFRKSIFSGYISGQITREGDVLIMWEFDDGVELTNQPSDWARDISRKLNSARNIVDLAAGDYKCIMSSKAMDVFGPIRSAMNARMVIKDMSPLKDKVGEQIFDPRIEIFDDGLHPERGATQPIDDEGVTSQVTHLVEGGVLKGFIHDLHTAGKMGVAPTGNGMRAGLSAQPRAGYTTLTIKPGEKTLDQMIAGMDRGIVIDQIMGAHQASPFSGDFSVSISVGYLVEDGKIVGRFKDSMLAGNVFKMLKDQVLEIGSEPKVGSIYAPPIMFDNMTVATAAN